ncbi:DinB family protein [Paenibacillus filicis]|uniref:DinB family protein n=1 Tax=Paenibacillus gyeongsangnamensis TaxID=3388067 RepID=A0ABT4Q7F1_9BACL|nr:DinB family protein [Paenibacillus filicis]MCZ8512798.1 DinB family protein [Paenibacillus filicis]
MEHSASCEFRFISKHRMMNHYYVKLKSCIESLNSDSLWFKEFDQQNSIGGIVMHILEHVKRNTLRLSDPDVIFAKGMEDTFTDAALDKDMLLQELERIFNAFDAAIDEAEFIDMYSIYHLVEHTGYHLGQIVDRAQRMTGRRYQFVQNGIHEKALKDQVDRDLKNDRTGC